MPSGIILKGIGGFYYVSVHNTVYECKARGKFRKEDTVPLPGDRVSLSVVDEAKKIGSIDEILPRDNVLVRPAVANINQVIVTIAVKSPAPDFMLLDKLLVTAEKKEIPVVICVNKIDLDVENEHSRILEAYSKAGYPLIVSSTKADLGLEQLKETLKGKISVLAGQSGVGKSTILNRIMNTRVMKTGDVSDKIERGKHTTRHAELVQLDLGGYIVDTPGFSSFELADITSTELELFYPEFAAHLNKCRFTGCSHISEPGCIVKEALKAGSVDQKRYERYVQLYQALKQNEENKWKK